MKKLLVVAMLLVSIGLSAYTVSIYVNGGMSKDNNPMSIETGITNAVNSVMVDSTVVLDFSWRNHVSDKDKFMFYLNISGEPEVSDMDSFENSVRNYFYNLLVEAHYDIEFKSYGTEALQ